MAASLTGPHFDVIIAYLTWNNISYTAHWMPDGFRFHHVSVEAHDVKDSDILAYRTWDGEDYITSWDVPSGRFKHWQNNPNDFRFDNHIKYLSTGRDRWTAFRAFQAGQGLGFIHIPQGSNFDEASGGAGFNYGDWWQKNGPTVIQAAVQIGGAVIAAS